MHELSILEQLLKIVEESAVSGGMERVTVVRLKIGQLRQIVPETLEMSFDILKKSTRASNARLEYEIIPLTARCTACSATFDIENYTFFCTQCGSRDIDVITGKELMIENIEGETDGAD